MTVRIWEPMGEPSQFHPALGRAKKLDLPPQIPSPLREHDKTMSACSNCPVELLENVSWLQEESSSILDRNKENLMSPLASVLDCEDTPEEPSIASFKSPLYPEASSSRNTANHEPALITSPISHIGQKRRNDNSVPSSRKKGVSILDFFARKS
jgi:hypothetical protein